jgi:hypothetical protein
VGGLIFTFKSPKIGPIRAIGLPFWFLYNARESNADSMDHRDLRGCVL